MVNVYNLQLFRPPVTRREFKGNVWRRLCAEAVVGNGGYSSGYHDRFALEWTVGVYESIPDWDALVELVNAGKCDDFSAEDLNKIEPSILAKVQAEWADERFLSSLYYHIAESMREGVTDTDSYRSVRPEIAARYGLPGSEAKLHSGRRYNKEHKYRAGAWDHTLMFDVEWQFAGRGGKHLCLTSFEGRNLEMSSDDLADAIRSTDEGMTDYDNGWCQKLLAFIRECDLCFTNENVKAEFQYQMLFRLGQGLNDALQASEAQRKEAAERQWAAERDIMTEET